jgi:hypothetical protein
VTLVVEPLAVTPASSSLVAARTALGDTLKLTLTD